MYQGSPESPRTLIWKKRGGAQIPGIQGNWELLPHNLLRISPEPPAGPTPFIPARPSLRVPLPHSRKYWFCSSFSLWEAEKHNCCLASLEFSEQRCFDCYTNTQSWSTQKWHLDSIRRLFPSPNVLFNVAQMKTYNNHTYKMRKSGQWMIVKEFPH